MVDKIDYFQGVRDHFENLEVKIPNSFEIETFPKFSVIEFVINDKNKTNKEVFKKTYVNKRFIRESIQHYDTKS